MKKTIFPVVVIDCFSKFVFTALLKRKQTEDIITAFKMTVNHCILRYQ